MAEVIIATLWCFVSNDNIANILATNIEVYFHMLTLWLVNKPT